ncbi:MAG: KilA-N domain-containing protein [Bacilli bacterium]|nr:KilA-N domain-containing protein [Bacilli bacterium]
MEKIKVKEVEISITGIADDDFINLTDIAKIANSEFPSYVVKNWLRLRSTIEFLGLWEKITNPNFNLVEFDHFKNESGTNSFVMTATKWVKQTNSVGFKTSRGKYSTGTYAHKDIALEFASWISPEVRLYIIKEFQRLKNKESNQLEWNGKRLLSKLNYLMQTEAIKEKLILVNLTTEQKNSIYASEADLINVALFGTTASRWRAMNPERTGNIRDYISTIELSILSNLELINSKLIEQGYSQKERLMILNREANKEKELFKSKNPKEVKLIESVQKGL